MADGAGRALRSRGAVLGVVWYSSTCSSWHVAQTSASGARQQVGAGGGVGCVAHGAVVARPPAVRAAHPILRSSPRPGWHSKHRAGWACRPGLPGVAGGAVAVAVRLVDHVVGQPGRVRRVGGVAGGAVGLGHREAACWPASGAAIAVVAVGADRGAPRPSGSWAPGRRGDRGSRGSRRRAEGAWTTSRVSSCRRSSWQVQQSSSLPDGEQRRLRRGVRHRGRPALRLRGPGVCASSGVGRQLAEFVALRHRSRPSVSGPAGARRGWRAGCGRRALAAREGRVDDLAVAQVRRRLRRGRRSRALTWSAIGAAPSWQVAQSRSAKGGWCRRLDQDRLGPTCGVRGSRCSRGSADRGPGGLLRKDRPALVVALEAERRRRLAQEPGARAAVGQVAIQAAHPGPARATETAPAVGARYPRGRGCTAALRAPQQVLLLRVVRRRGRRCSRRRRPVRGRASRVRRPAEPRGSSGRRRSGSAQHGRRASPPWGTWQVQARARRRSGRAGCRRAAVTRSSWQRCRVRRPRRRQQGRLRRDVGLVAGQAFAAGHRRRGRARGRSPAAPLGGSPGRGRRPAAPAASAGSELWGSWHVVQSCLTTGAWVEPVAGLRAVAVAAEAELSGSSPAGRFLRSRGAGGSRCSAPSAAGWLDDRAGERGSSWQSRQTRRSVARQQPRMGAAVGRVAGQALAVGGRRVGHGAGPAAFVVAQAQSSVGVGDQGQRRVARPRGRWCSRRRPPARAGSSAAGSSPSELWGSWQDTQAVRPATAAGGSRPAWSRSSWQEKQRASGSSLSRPGTAAAVGVVAGRAAVVFAAACARACAGTAPRSWQR